MKTTTILAALLLSVPAFADLYKVDTAGSSIKWTGSKITGAKHSGGIAFKDGSIELKNGAPVGGSFTVDMNTLTNEDLAADPGNQKKLVGHLKADDFFKVEKFPEAKFVIKSVESKSKTDFVLKGDFTMIGQTQAIEVPAKISVTGANATGEATLKLDRTKWGLKYGSGKFFQNLGDKVINDEFELVFKVAAKK